MVVKTEFDNLDAHEFRMQEYSSSGFGSMSSLGVSSVVWILLLLTLTLDYYVYGVFASIAGKSLRGIGIFLLPNSILAEVRQWWTLSDNYESSITGIASNFQIIYAAAAFNIVSTYRKGFFCNTSFISMYAIQFTTQIPSTASSESSNPLYLTPSCWTKEALTELGFSQPWFFGRDTYYSAIGHNVIPWDFDGLCGGWVWLILRLCDVWGRCYTWAF
jgi:hypothetical protein